MRKSLVLTLAVLSLSLLSISPHDAPTKRRISSVCDPTVPAVAEPGSPGFNLSAYFASAMKRQSEDAFAMFNRQIEYNLALFRLPSQNPFLMPLPQFPSYSLPNVADYQIDMTKPKISMIFGGLSANPDLKYLVQPPAPSALLNPLGAANNSPTAAPMEAGSKKAMVVYF